MVFRVLAALVLAGNAYALTGTDTALGIGSAITGIAVAAVLILRSTQRELETRRGWGRFLMEYILNDMTRHQPTA